LNVKTGLKGDGTSKYIDSNRNNNADGQDDAARSVYVTDVSGADANMFYMSSRLAAPDALFLNSRTNISTRSRNLTLFERARNPTGFVGCSRSDAVDYTMRDSGIDTNVTRDSEPPGGDALWVFARSTASNTPEFATAARQSLYHIGPALDLATMDGILTTFMEEVDAV
jgi:hypothetical protein